MQATPPLPHKETFGTKKCRFGVHGFDAPKPFTQGPRVAHTPGSAGSAIRNIAFTAGKLRHGKLASSTGHAEGFGADSLDKASAQVFRWLGRWPTAICSPRLA